MVTVTVTDFVPLEADEVYKVLNLGAAVAVVTASIQIASSTQQIIPIVRNGMVMFVQIPIV